MANPMIVFDATGANRLTVRISACRPKWSVSQQGTRRPTWDQQSSAPSFGKPRFGEISGGCTAVFWSHTIIGREGRVSPARPFRVKLPTALLAIPSLLDSCYSELYFLFAILEVWLIAKKPLVERSHQCIESSKHPIMMNTQFTSTPAMSIEIHLGTSGSRNPMDLASLLNPLLTPPSSESEEEWDEGEQEVHESLNGFHSCYSAPQPMEVDGELPTNATWEHHEREVPLLPPMHLILGQRRLINLAHRPTQGLRMAQIARRTSESDSVRRHTRPTSRSPHRRHDRHDRRGSYPRLSIASRRPMTSPSPSLDSESSHEGEERKIGNKKKRKPTGPHSNKPYTQEQLHWLRYFCEDRGFKYHEMYRAWNIQFPGDYREPKQAFSSRLYRENIYATLDDNGELARDRDGKPEIIPIGKRQRHNPKYRDFPFKLWEHSPEWALYWDWVLPEHKVMAQRILDGRDLDESQLRKEKSRRAIRLYEAEGPLKKGWFATPALHAAAVQKAKAKNETTRFSTSPSPELAAVIKLESQKTSYWSQEYDIGSNGRKL
ncbi:hypothetical protein DL98DRAFT_572176 [Cadophora sp. DSE1049]|nr:hypothetical protein DL98DRAFT_572176 [Cadophora sp. DSE1049]